MATIRRVARALFRDGDPSALIVGDAWMPTCVHMYVLRNPGRTSDLGAILAPTLCVGTEDAERSLALH